MIIDKRTLKKVKTVRLLIMTIALLSIAQIVKAQDDYSFYLQKARQRLAEGDCDGAQRSYNVYKDLTGGKTDVQLEHQLGDCFLPNAFNRHSFVDSIGDLSFAMVYVEGGTDTLGRTSSQDYNDGKIANPHVVTLSGYYIGKYEVTYAEFEIFVEETGYVTDAEKEGGAFLWMKKEDKWDNIWVSELNWRYGPDGNKRGFSEKKHPVLYVSWNDAVAYCEWLKSKTGKSYCLPTEAQWEFAAKGGKWSKGYKFSGDSTGEKIGWWGHFNSGSKTQSIGLFAPNELGIFDMSGNAQEWCDDWYGTIDNDFHFNPSGPTEGYYKVVRGGAWSFYSKCCQVSHRHKYTPSYSRGDLGFRVAISDLKSLDEMIIQKSNGERELEKEGIRYFVEALTEKSWGYHGEFEYDKYLGHLGFGHWKYYYNNGDIYEGDWEKSQPNGNGVLIKKDGEKYEGYWENGYMSQGVLYWPNGDIYKGEFEKGRINGKGLLTRKNGETMKGNWEYGKFAGNTPKTDESPMVDCINTKEGDLIFIVNGVSFTMKLVEGGAFLMGAQCKDIKKENYDRDAEYDEKPVHSVTLSSYYIGETEVIQALWEAVMNDNPCYYLGDNLPVESVSYNDIVQEFLPKLNLLTGKKFRLPTEAEWEYAARGGNKSHGYKYSGSDAVDTVAWYTGNSQHKTHVVKGKAPNELGLYDMSGNVSEMTDDAHDDYRRRSQTNPQTAPTYSLSERGGSWGSSKSKCRVSARDSHWTNWRFEFTGFRLAFSE